MDVNVTLASWSNLLIYSAMAVYVFAFLLYAVDLFGGTTTLEEKSAQGESKARATGSGRGESASAAKGMRGRTSRARVSASESAASGATATAVLDREDDAEAPARSAGGSGSGAASGDGSARSRRWARSATALIVIAAVLHLAAAVARTAAVMRVPWANMMEYALIASLIIVAAYLVTLRFRDFRYLGTFVAGGVLVALGLCITVFYTDAAEVIPALDNYWIWIHVPIAILSTALLYLSAAIAVFQIAKTVVERRTAPKALRFLNRMPASGDLEKFSYRLAAVGFVTWTFTLIAGAIWAEIAWGRYWGWDAKEIWTFVVWVIYAAYLHARSTRGWSPVSVAVLNLVGYLALQFNFTIVNVYFNGLHAYSGV